MSDDIITASTKEQTIHISTKVLSTGLFTLEFLAILLAVLNCFRSNNLSLRLQIQDQSQSSTVLCAPVRMTPYPPHQMSTSSLNMLKHKTCNETVCVDLLRYFFYFDRAKNVSHMLPYRWKGRVVNIHISN